MKSDADSLRLKRRLQPVIKTGTLVVCIREQLVTQIIFSFRGDYLIYREGGTR